MENMMEYKGYIAAVSYDGLGDVFCGSVVNAGTYSFATFEATDVKQLRKEFQFSVDDYLSSCKEDSIEPIKPFYGKIQSLAQPAAEHVMDPRPVVLVGEHVRLEPVGQQHAADLYRIGQEESIWRYLSTPPFTSLDDARAWVDMCVGRNASGERVQFAVIHGAEERAIGSTGYLDIDRPNRALEIGTTWYGLDYQRTAVNTECKYLLMRHAFEDLGARRVCLKTDHRNERSQRAILRIGAQREGVLRNHRIARDGVNRHSHYFSVIDTEWPDVKERLEGMMDR